MYRDNANKTKLVSDTTVITFWWLVSQIRVLLFFNKPPQNLMKKRVQQNKTNQCCYYQKSQITLKFKPIRSMVLLLLYIFIWRHRTSSSIHLTGIFKYYWKRMYLSFIKLALITWKKKQELQFILFKLIYSLMNRLAQAQTRKKNIIEQL